MGHRQGAELTASSGRPEPWSRYAPCGATRPTGLGGAGGFDGRRYAAAQPTSYYSTDGICSTGGLLGGG